MSDNESVDSGFVTPWSTTILDEAVKQKNILTDKDYFPNDFPLNSMLVTPDVSNGSERSPLDIDAP